MLIKHNSKKPVWKANFRIAQALHMDYMQHMRLQQKFEPIVVASFNNLKKCLHYINLAEKYMVEQGVQDK